MDQRAISPHESIQLHELLTFKNLTLTKSVTMTPLVSDKELKTIFQNEAATSKQHIQELSDLMKYSNMAASEAAQP